MEPVPFLLVPPDVTGGAQEPPAYRYLSEDNGLMVQYGPTMLAVNAIRWPGYEAFIDIVRWVAAQFYEVASDSLITGYSLGFYNRISIKAILDLRQILRFQLNIDETTMASEFVCQFARRVDEGSMLTQIITSPVAMPDESIRIVGVNNIVRLSLDAKKYVVADWCAWLDRAHERAKEEFWNSLTPETQKAWEATASAT